MSSHISNIRPKPDKVLVDIADYITRYTIRSKEAYNTARRRFPANMTAKLFGFEEYPYWEVPKEAQAVPKVDFGR